MQCEAVLEQLRAVANPKNVLSMARFGISTENTLGISVATLRKLARGIGHDHDLARHLWDSGLHEARILASIVDDPKKVTEEQMEHWAKEIDSWDICDGCCANLFEKTPFAYRKAVEWSDRPEEFVKRAAFVLMARLAARDKKAPDQQFEKFLLLVKREATDDRNTVKKGISWALRQIGKRTPELNERAVRLAREIQRLDSRSARWIALDALREVTSHGVQERLTLLSAGRTRWTERGVPSPPKSYALRR